MRRTAFAELAAAVDGARLDPRQRAPGSQSRMALSMEQIAAQPEKPVFMLLSRYVT